MECSNEDNSDFIRSEEMIHDLFETPGDEKIESLLEFAERRWDADLAMFTHVPEGHQWLKSSISTDPNEVDPKELFCLSTIVSDDPLTVEDTMTNGHFDENYPTLQGHTVRSHAGISFPTQQGLNVGVLSVYSSEAESLGTINPDPLTHFGSQIQSLFDQHAKPTQSNHILFYDTNSGFQKGRSIDEPIQERKQTSLPTNGHATANSEKTPDSYGIGRILSWVPGEFGLIPLPITTPHINALEKLIKFGESVISKINQQIEYGLHEYNRILGDQLKISEIELLQNEPLRDSTRSIIDQNGSHETSNGDEPASDLRRMVFQLERTRNGEYIFTYTSDALKAITGHEARNSNQQFGKLVARTHEEDLNALLNSLDQSAKLVSPWRHEFRVMTENDKIRWLLGTAEPERRRDGAIVWIGNFIDITERKEYEEDLRTSLEQKETLLDELNHRTKNNFQVILSLMNLEQRQNENDNLAEMVSASRQRIRAMYLIHQKLSETGTNTELDVAEYIRDLVSTIQNINQDHQPKVTIQYNLDGIRLDANLAFYCGLIINELVNNAFEHAFGEHAQSPELKIDFHSRPNGYSLSVHDNGSGLPDDIELDNTESLGLSLVNNLVHDQLGGTLRVDRHSSTVFEIEFPKDKNIS